MIRAAVAAAVVAVPIAMAAPANATTWTGYYFPIVGRSSPMLSGSSLTTTGNTSDWSKPTAILRNADGCTIELYITSPSLTESNAVSGHGFTRGVVTAGASPTCQDSSTMSLSENKIGDEWAFNIQDMDNQHAWALRGPDGP
jgi:hypothetical protein